ncbi:MAG: hypothetical protein R2713_13580 [Ilumatobacteraceae bacterium]
MGTHSLRRTDARIPATRRRFARNVAFREPGERRGCTAHDAPMGCSADDATSVL